MFRIGRTVEPIRSAGRSWRVMRPTSKGRWTYLFRAVDKEGTLILGSEPSGTLQQPRYTSRRQGIAATKEVCGEPPNGNQRRSAVPNTSTIDRQDHRSSVEYSASNIFGESQRQLSVSNSGIGPGRVSLQRPHHSRRMMSRWSLSRLFLTGLPSARFTNQSALRWFITHTSSDVLGTASRATHRAGPSWVRSCRGCRPWRRRGMRAHRCGAGRR